MSPGPMIHCQININSTAMRDPFMTSTVANIFRGNRMIQNPDFLLEIKISIYDLIFLVDFIVKIIRYCQI